MKIIFSSISRLFFSYSKFLASIILLSTISNNAYSSDLPTYLKCNNNYYKLTGISLGSNYNVRTKKFRDLDYIRQYSENFITTDYLSINRNNGQLKINGKLKCIVKKISFNDLPELNDEGKLF
tara:strand:+ start:118 stop:486 length:369 start_codon:yes stop_codon:yes gene_type:complete